jgi:hypothetical protein
MQEIPITESKLEESQNTVPTGQTPVAATVADKDKTRI